MGKITNSQLEMYSQAFKRIHPNITEQDKKDAAVKFNLSYSLVKKYAFGEVYKLGTCEKLLDFFTERIKSRNDKLNAVLIDEQAA